MNLRDVIRLEHVIVPLHAVSVKQATEHPIKSSALARY